MPSLQIGRTEITYELRRSTAISERRITVTPDHVQVVVLPTDDDVEIAGFLKRKRQWLFNTVREMKRVTANRHAVPRFMTGSKIPFRGRQMSLTVRRSDGKRIEVNYHNRFFVDLPSWVNEDADRLVASELRLWLRQRARRDVKEIAEAYRRRFALVPPSIRVGDFANGWGSCGSEGNILINWQLIFAPKQVLEYVVAHELAHLRFRSHETEFWNFLASILPHFERPKAWLEANQGRLSADFFDAAN